MDLEPLEQARAIVDVLTDRMASDVLLLDISDVTIIADYFVIGTGETERQVRALSRAVTDAMAEDYGVKPLAVEGTAASGWLLLDYGAVVVHIFLPRQREFYQLEELWNEARTIVRIA